MKCPYCDSEIANRTGRCPHCAAEVTYTAPETFEPPQEYPSGDFTMYNEEKPKKKTNKAGIIIAGIIILIMLLLGVSQFVRTASIKHNSTLTAATLVDSQSSYTQVDRTTRKSGKTRKTYYELEVYQHLVVQYTIEGETFTKDMGTHEVYETESRSNYTQSERDSYLHSHTYKIGDTFDVYVTKNGTVHLASAVNAQSRSSIMIMGFGGLVIVLLAIPSKKKKRNR